MLHILYLDDYHLGDPMFLGRLARGLAAAELELAIVHSSMEAVERGVESLGIFPSRNAAGMLDLTDAEAIAVAERVCRDQNRGIAHELNEAGVAAARMEASSRGLLVGDDEGGLRVGNTDWFTTLAGSGVIPVIAPLAESGGQTGMLDAARLIQLLAEALPDSVALFLTRKSSLPHKPGIDDLSDPAAAQSLVDAGISVAIAPSNSFDVKSFEIISFT